MPFILKGSLARSIGIVIFLTLMFMPLYKTDALTINIHIPERYTDVSAGERVYFEVDIKFPENPSRRDLQLFYEIEHDGEVVAQAQFLKAIETQASFIDYIVLPESASTGLHTIRANIQDYQELDEEVSATFFVTARPSIVVYFYILLGAIASVGVLVVWQMIRISKLTKRYA